MKVLTIREPWATLVVEGMKEFEFRSWNTSYRGRILIHAGKYFEKEVALDFESYGFEYGKGEIIGEAVLVDCIYIDDDFDKMLQGMNSLVYGRKSRVGKYAWKFEKVKRYDCHYLVKGQLGLWNYECDKVIALYDDGYLCYDEGNFDSWCVYEFFSDGKREAPRDLDCFLELEEFASLFGSERVYDDFIRIYDATTKLFDIGVVELIRKIAFGYLEYSEDIFRIFAILYMAMVAEENKKNTKLGRRIKRLGVYYLLVLGKEAKECVSFMKGYDWRVIDRLCLEGGF